MAFCGYLDACWSQRDDDKLGIGCRSELRAGVGL